MVPLVPIGAVRDSEIERAEELGPTRRECQNPPITANYKHQSAAVTSRPEIAVRLTPRVTKPNRPKRHQTTANLNVPNWPHESRTRAPKSHAQNAQSR